jgi:ABC-type amino acid transport substrate-binding protein
MPRSLTYVLLTLVAVLPPSLARADLKEIVARGSLRVLTGFDEQPELYSFAQTGEPGFEREIIEGFARLHRIKVESVPVTNFDEIIAMLNRGDGDLITGFIDTPVRRQSVAFTAEILPSRHAVLTRKPSAVIRTLEEFRKARVGVLPGTSWETEAVAAGVPRSNLIPFTDMKDLLTQLKSGGVQATVMAVSDATLAVRRDPALQLGLFLGAPGHSAFGIRKKDPELLRAFDDYLANLRKSATYSRLVVKYFGNDALRVLGRARKE